MNKAALFVLVSTLLPFSSKTCDDRLFLFDEECIEEHAQSAYPLSQIKAATKSPIKIAKHHLSSALYEEWRQLCIQTIKSAATNTNSVTPKTRTVITKKQIGKDRVEQLTTLGNQKITKWMVLKPGMNVPYYETLFLNNELATCTCRRTKKNILKTIVYKAIKKQDPNYETRKIAKNGNTCYLPLLRKKQPRKMPETLANHPELMHHHIHQLKKSINIPIPKPRQTNKKPF